MVAAHKQYTNKGRAGPLLPENGKRRKESELVV